MPTGRKTSTQTKLSSVLGISLLRKINPSGEEKGLSFSATVPPTVWFPAPTGHGTDMAICVESDK